MRLHASPVSPFLFGRHHGGHGFGRFGNGFLDEGGMGGRRFGMGRKLGAPDLQLMIVGLLAERPRHGYDIIKALGERSKGFYVPSAGMVYPALTYLEEAGHAQSEAQGNRKMYRLTAAGLEYLAQNRATFDAMLAQFERIGTKMARVRRAFVDDAGETDAMDEARRDRRERGGISEFVDARRSLRAALDGTAQKSPEEQLRIAALLTRAIREINGR